MPIVIWVVAVIGFVGFVASIVWFFWAVRNQAKLEFPLIAHLICAIVATLLAIAMSAGSLFWLYGTAPGQRELKSFASETSGGLSRVVKVYDLQGDLIDTYEGTFDIQEDSSKVFFDLPQEDGSTKRVQIYNATVIVEEQ